MLKTTLAKRIVKSAADGERNRERLRDAALTDLAAYRPQSASRGMSCGRATGVVKNDDQTALVLQAAQRRSRHVFKIRRGEAGATELQLG